MRLPLNLVGVPIAFHLFLTSIEHPNRDVFELLGWLFAYSHFFHRGYLNYTLGFWMMFVALALHLRALRTRHSLYWVGVALLSLLTYFTHIIPFLVLCLVIGLIVLKRPRSRDAWVSMGALIPGLSFLLYTRLSQVSLRLTWYTNAGELIRALLGLSSPRGMCS
jgi:hypothetical protein